MMRKSEMKFNVISEKSRIFARERQKKGRIMSTATLEGLRDYLFDTLSPNNMLWLSTQLANYAKQKEQKPYTIEEIHNRIAQSERNIAEGRVCDFDDAMRELEEGFEFADKKLEMAEAI